MKDNKRIDETLHKIIKGEIPKEVSSFHVLNNYSSNISGTHLMFNSIMNKKNWKKIFKIAKTYPHLASNIVNSVLAKDFKETKKIIDEK